MCLRMVVHVCYMHDTHAMCVVGVVYEVLNKEKKLVYFL